ncbi:MULTISPECIES: NifU N-terminal domain-containing protein [Staphylococcus]|uniref:NifU N-terminal domain-containing protein n=1 Tax=Staphylococcus hsinchuensis TaxID=3051183 RepID=A0ABZ3EC41_9STAP|nr:MULTISPECIES: NifU N-terminal domain-containing protein [unclassified Staphylococcus]
MDYKSVTSTPSPDTIKIVLNKEREDNQSTTYTKSQEGQPLFINELLQIEGVKSIFYVMDFISIDKTPEANWDDLTPKITERLTEL